MANLSCVELSAHRRDVQRCHASRVDPVYNEPVDVWLCERVRPDKGER